MKIYEAIDILQSINKIRNIVAGASHISDYFDSEEDYNREIEYLINKLDTYIRECEVKL